MRSASATFAIAVAFGMFGLGLVGGSAYAVPLVVDPVTGLDAVAIDQRFFWVGGLGPIDSIGTPGGGGFGAFDPIYEITVALDSTIDAMAVDGFVPGDVFELVFDGSPIAWDNSFFDGSGFFHGEMVDLFLVASIHTFTINVTAGLSSGGAWLSFSSANSVPEASTSLLLSLGLVGLAVLRRRRAKP